MSNYHTCQHLRVCQITKNALRIHSLLSIRAQIYVVHSPLKLHHAVLDGDCRRKVHKLRRRAVL